MTVAELIKELQAMPQDAKVLAHVSDIGYAVVDPGLEISYARQDDSDWWQVYWSRGKPTIPGFQAVIIL